MIQQGDTADASKSTQITSSETLLLHYSRGNRAGIRDNRTTSCFLDRASIHSVSQTPINCR